MDMRSYLPAFLAEAREHLQELGLAVVAIEADPRDRETAEQVFRIAHSLKGMSATMGFDAIATLTHAMEDVFELLRQRADGLSQEAVTVLSSCLDALEEAIEAIAADGAERLDPAPLVAQLELLARERTPAQELARGAGDPGPGAVGPAARPRNGAATVRVDAERLDELLHLMGELVVHRTTVEALLSDVSVPGLTPALQRLTRSSQELQAVVTRVRMTPVEAVFLRFPRLVRDLAARLGKQVELRLVGQQTELDRTTVDALGDPLVHLVRNALDHGLESPAERVAAGKPATGVLEISARHAGAHVIVSVRDDGRGIDVEAVGRTALARGLIDAEQAAALDDAAALELLFAPGFSTAAQTTDVSGRGIGMDAVRAGVRALGGEVTLSSTRGAGMRAEVRLPLTLASVVALLVQVDGLLYAIPLDRVERTLRLPDRAVHSVAGTPMLSLHGEVLPLLDAGAALGRGASGEREHAVIVRAGDRRVALAVGRLLGQRELVTRPLPRDARAHPAVTSGAVLPDGAIALAVDCDALRSHAAPAPSIPSLVAA